VGDVVEYSPRNTFPFRVMFDKRGRLHTTCWNDGIELVMIWQGAIMTVDPEASAESAMLGLQSAGFDRHGNFMSGAEAWHRT